VGKARRLFLGWDPFLLANISLWWTWRRVTNALAYNTAALVTTLKTFVVQASVWSNRLNSIFFLVLSSFLSIFNEFFCRDENGRDVQLSSAPHPSVDGGKRVGEFSSREGGGKQARWLCRLEEESETVGESKKRRE